MKHKNFDSVHAYGYFLVRKSDNTKYVGVRYANVKKNLTPNEDFGRVYFTSGKLKKEFKSNPENFYFRLTYTFDTLEDMFEWERKIALRVYKRNDWANQGWASNFKDNPEIGKLISDGKYKTRQDGLTSVEIGALKLKDWIWNTEEGVEWRNYFSGLQKERHSSMTEGQKQQNLSNLNSVDKKERAKKVVETKSKVGDDGLTTWQRAATKSHQTKLENGSYETQGKKFSEWAWNTEEGNLYREQASTRSKAYRDSLTDNEIKEQVRKANATKSAKSAEEKQAIIEKQKATLSEVGEDGLTISQRSAKLTKKTKEENGIYEKASKKRGELFNKKLGEMSEEEFESYCANYRPRLAKSFATRRNKYLQQIGQE